MEAQCLIDPVHQRGGHLAQPFADSFDGNRPDLLSLRLGIALKASYGRGEQDVKRVDAFDVRRDGHDGDDPSPKPPGGHVRRVIADDDSGDGACSLPSLERDPDLQHGFPRAASRLQPIARGGVPQLGLVSGRPFLPCAFVADGEL